MAQCNTVPADRAKIHLKLLEKAGVGYRQVARKSGLTPRAILRIRHGEVATIRRLTEQRILHVPPQRALGSLVRPRMAWRQLASLLAEGFTLTDLGRRLGLRGPWRRRRTDWIRVQTAVRLRALHRAHIDDPALTP